MALFLSSTEKDLLAEARKSNPIQPFYWALAGRVEQRASSPGLVDLSSTVEWWHLAAEYLTDAAMMSALKPSPAVTCWLRDTTLSIARRPLSDWIGPAFRDHQINPPAGNLETAHLTWSIAIVLDLASDLFSEAERDELQSALREKGVALCQRQLNQRTHLNNWSCILNAGIAVAAAVLNDTETIKQTVEEFHRCVDIFQPDGSSAESLQYGNYASYGLMLTREALVRHTPELDTTLPLAPYVKKPRGDAASLFYQKPLSGWGSLPRPRSTNFNDSSAIYRPSADVLLHIAVRAKYAHPKDAGLARWLFETLYQPCIEQGPHDRASFGFVNDFGFLTLPLLLQAADAIPPENAGIPLAARFSCGDVLVRDEWADQGGRTVLAIRGAGDALHGPGHLHGDLNSFILVHNRERLLLDPGHSCYRNLIRDLDCSTQSHNTCTFLVETIDENGSKKTTILEQSRNTRRDYDPETGHAAGPVRRGGRTLLIARDGEVSVVASEAAELYGDPITQFTRFWFLCGSSALFIVDRIVSDRPVRTSWNWLLNNRDEQLNLKLVHPDRLVARRGNAGMKLFHLAENPLGNPVHAFVHDAYHPLPNQQGEGKPGSGILLNWTEEAAATARTIVHAIAVDDPGAVVGWHLKTGENTVTLEGPGEAVSWTLETAPDADRFVLTEAVSKKQYSLINNQGSWQMKGQTTQ